MSAGKRALVVGNWKMNGLRGSLAEVQELKRLLSGSKGQTRVVLCPPATLIGPMRDALGGSGILVGGQDCHPDEGGAHTGDISARMLADAGAQYVIVGHSERRAEHGETDDLVCRKAQSALKAGLIPIICVGETKVEREGGQAEAVVRGQLAASVPPEASGNEIAVAYEPVWAIGTGLTATAADIESMHRSMREALVARFGASSATVPLLYGGSVKPANAGEILAIDEVNGALVGGASLLAKDFFAIISAA